MENNSTIPTDESSVDNLLGLIKDQAKELKMSKKKLEKLEEKYIKNNADLKIILNDKMNLENFLKTIFPKDMHEMIIKSENGLYDSAELSKMFHVCESKKQNEFQQILNKYKNENIDLLEKTKVMTKELESKLNELNDIKKTHSTSSDQLSFYQNNYNELVKKVDGLENEKGYLMKIIDEKNEEIENLMSLEVENAELKAKTLLENLDGAGDLNLNKRTSEKNYWNINAGNASTSLSGGDSSHSQGQRDLEKNIKIVSLNVGCQTTEQLFSADHVNNLEKQIADLKQKLEKNKKDFNDYKEKSHKILLGNEENYSKILKENEKLKKEISLLIENKNSEMDAVNNITESNHFNNLSNSSPSKKNGRTLSLSTTNILNTFKNNYTGPNSTNLHEKELQKINIEYLKNVLLKYLESIALGNEFQIKILENVIFTILNIPNEERLRLEEKRSRSSFYYNLWYNAKAFLSAKIYGNSDNPQGHTSDSSLNKFEISQGDLENVDKISMLNKTNNQKPKMSEEGKKHTIEESDEILKENESIRKNIERNLNL